ncbi:hypothetical protein SDC9_199919 [bioreactor metagenome]|uniref:Uncharacterized protein n=1 Tax=bioreactor metagenome TaxID=1076179 RepID=A0A645IYG7_9ZZZZ
MNASVQYTVREVKLNGSSVSGTTFEYWTISTGAMTSNQIDAIMATAQQEKPNVLSSILSDYPNCPVLTVLNTYRDGGGGGGDDNDDTPTPVVIPNNPTPLSPTPGTITDIPDGDVPQAEIPDGETPLAATPATGDNLILWVLAAGVSGIGLVWVSLLGRKRRDEDGSQN